MWDDYAVWEKQFLIISISHCEGPDHLERMDMLVDLGDRMIEEAPEALREGYADAKAQAERVREIIRQYGRHPHRNGILGRVSTVQEMPYLERGEFPHERKIEHDGTSDA